MNLGFDIDGVISDFAVTLANVVKNQYDLKITKAEMFYHDLNLLLGISNKEKHRLITETLLEDLTLIDGAKEALNNLYYEGNQILLLTARPKEMELITKSWLDRKCIPYSKLFLLNEGKKHIADVKLDLVVEDNLEDALGWSKKVENILVFDQPWNKSFNVNGLFKRVYCWKDILDEIEQLKISKSPKLFT